MKTLSKVLEEIDEYLKDKDYSEEVKKDYIITELRIAYSSLYFDAKLNMLTQKIDADINTLTSQIK